MLWTALTVSLVGTQLSALAIPLTAIGLGATTLQLGFLAGLRDLPFAIFSIPLGPWIDGHRRQPVLIVTDLARCVALLWIPLGAALGVLDVVQLAAITFITFGLTVPFELAHYSFVPIVVGRDRLVRANGWLQASYASAQAAGPGVAGALVQFVGGPIAVALDALSYLISGVLVWRMPTVPEPVGRVGGGMWDGARHLFAHPHLRAIILVSIVECLATGGLQVLYLLLMVRELLVPPAVVGLLFACAGAGAVAGGLVSDRLAWRFGAGRVMTIAWCGGYVVALEAVFARGDTLLILALVLAASAFLWAIGNVLQWSLRQILTPDAVLGRVTAAQRFFVYGSSGLGALLDGALAELVGVRTALLAVTMIGALATVALATQPLFGLRAIDPSARRESSS